METKEYVLSFRHGDQVLEAKAELPADADVKPERMLKNLFERIEVYLRPQGGMLYSMSNREEKN